MIPIASYLVENTRIGLLDGGACWSGPNRTNEVVLKEHSFNGSSMLVAKYFYRSVRNRCLSLK